MDSESRSKNLKEEPLVTVCVPVYNGEKFIVEALESIDNQTYKNLECHIINNASTDKTEELVTDFISDKPKFKLHTFKEFVGLTQNWNRTVSYITDETKYFKVVQADDVIFSESVKVHVDLMEQFPTAGIASSYRFIGTNVYGYGIDYFKGNCHNGKEVLKNHLSGAAEITGSITQLLFRVEHLKKVPGYPEVFNPEELHVDTLLAYEMFLISDLAFSFEVLSFTRRHTTATTITLVERFNTYIQARESSLYRFREEFPELDKRYSKVRRSYAYFLFKNYLKNNKECIRWHNKYLKRKIKPSEYLSGIFWENRLGAKLSKRLGH